MFCASLLFFTKHLHGVTVTYLFDVLNVVEKFTCPNTVTVVLNIPRWTTQTYLHLKSIQQVSLHDFHYIAVPWAAAQVRPQ